MAIRRLLGVYSLTLLGLFAASARRVLDLAPASAPLALWSPFLSPLVSAGCEMALLVSIPAAALCARASLLSARRTVVAALALALPTIMAALMLDTSGVAPGRMAQQLIDAARDACPDAPERSVPVPLLPLTWSCPPGAPAVASGRLPFGPKVDFRLATIRVSPDVKRIDIERLTLDAPPTPTRLGLHLRADRARLIGLAPWGRPRDLPAGERLLRCALIGAALVAAGLAFLARQRLGATLATLLGLSSGLILVLLQLTLDRHSAPDWSYWLGVAVGPLLLLGLGAGLAIAERRWRERSVVARGGS